MKTTVEISDSLLRQARKRATREGVTLRALLERALRHVVADAGRDVPFRLRRASINGNGLQAEFQDASWDKLRDTAYRGRGA